MAKVHNIAPDSEDEDGDTSESELNFLFSPGWIQKFMSLHNDVCVDSEPIEPWINEWLTFLHTEYVIKHHKTLKQVISIIVNFDECGFQYKSLPQYSYHGRKEEIRAKKTVRARITGFFGAAGNGRKFRPLIIGKAANPRAFQHLRSQNQTISDVLPISYAHSSNAWMTAEIFRN